MMTTTDVLHELGEKWLPFPVEHFFTPQRAPDMWFGDELPPTLQDELRNPLVTQSKLMLRYQILHGLAEGEQREMQRAAVRRFAAAKAKVGGRKRK